MPLRCAYFLPDRYAPYELPTTPLRRGRAMRGGEALTCQLLVVAVLHHAHVRPQRGEGVGGHLGPGPRHRPQQRRLASVRKPDLRAVVDSVACVETDNMAHSEASFITAITTDIQRSSCIKEYSKNCISLEIVYKHVASCQLIFRHFIMDDGGQEGHHSSHYRLQYHRVSGIEFKMNVAPWCNLRLE